MEELKADGTIKSIISNYIGEEKGKHPYKTPEGTKYSGKKLVAATNATFPPYEYYENEKQLPCVSARLRTGHSIHYALTTIPAISYNSPNIQ